MPVNIQKAIETRGWMSEAELTWLADQASRHSLVVEVGSYYGRSCRALGDNCPGKVIAVDTWVGPISLNTRQALPSFEADFRKNLEDLIASGKVTPYTPESPLLELIHPDMVFIDGDHEYHSVKKDLAFWLQRINPGGLLCGHDFCCLDVGRAVGEYITSPEPVMGTDIWFTYV